MGAEHFWILSRAEHIHESYGKSSRLYGFDKSPIIIAFVQPLHVASWKSLFYFLFFAWVRKGDHLDFQHFTVTVCDAGKMEPPSFWQRLISMMLKPALRRCKEGLEWDVMSVPCVCRSAGHALSHTKRLLSTQMCWIISKRHFIPWWGGVCSVVRRSHGKGIRTQRKPLAECYHTISMSKIYGCPLLSNSPARTPGPFFFLFPL